MSDAVRETHATYDRIAGAYAQRAGTPYEQLDQHVRRFVDALGPGARVGDVGCGPGRDTRALRAAGLVVVGFDLSAGQLRVGGLPGVVQADMRALPAATSILDGVWCQAALLHLPRGFVPTALAEFARVTRPGGRLMLTVAEGDAEGFEHTVAYADHELRRWFTYHREADLRRLLAAAGFAVGDVERHRSNRDWLTVHASRG
jgi:SAM-dependent methyltransferase